MKVVYSVHYSRYAMNKLVVELFSRSIFFSLPEREPEVVKSNNQYLTVENLKKFTNYTVWILAYTKVGDGIKTKPLHCRTHEDGKFYDLFYLSL